MNTDSENMNTWNDEFGDWQNLEDYQGPLYQEVARLIRRFSPKGFRSEVLDVGCGEALLLGYLGEEVRYHGIEPSAKAAASARRKAASIKVTSAEHFDAGEDKWDCVVLSEVLYYTSKPIDVIEKFAALLKPDGIIIVSIYQKAENPGLRAKLFGLMGGQVPITNISCTKMLRDFMAKARWRIEEDEPLSIAGHSEHWQIWVIRPNAQTDAGRKLEEALPSN